MSLNTSTKPTTILDTLPKKQYKRLTVEDLIGSYTKEQLMKIMKFFRIHKIQALSIADIDKIARMNPDDPQLTEIKENEDE